MSADKITVRENGDKLTIRSNYHVRELVSYADLPDDAKPDFDYMLTSDIITEDDLYTPRFVLYLGSWYDTSDTDGSWNGMPAVFRGWHTYISDSFFSGVLFRFPDFDDDTVVIGRYWV
jgi:hypothetical protein